MKTIKVVAAIITKEEDGENLIFATQRGYGEFKDGWEFPGGKVEAGESPEEALIREIQEELKVLISTDEHFYTIEYDYPSFHLSMDCFICHIEKGSPILMEHEAAKWLNMKNINSVSWLPADVEVVKKLQELYQDS